MSNRPKKAIRDEELEALGLTVSAREESEGTPLAIAGLDIGAKGNQNADDLQMPILRRYEKRRLRGR